MTVKELRAKHEQQKGRFRQLEKQLETYETEIVQQRRQLMLHEKAREVIKEVGLSTQKELEFHIGNITSLALESIFENPYQLKVDFVQRRNKTECDLLFVQDDGTTMKPLSASGGGAVDVAAFALRIASWSMQHPRTQPVIILDEPMRFLSQDNQEKASKMLKEISQRLGIQFIIVTHEEILTSYADKVFKVTNRKGKSKVE